MNLKKYFNPVWRQARALKNMVLNNQQFREALKELEAAAINALLAFVLEEVLRRRLPIGEEVGRQISRVAQQVKP